MTAIPRQNLNLRTIPRTLTSIKRGFDVWQDWGSYSLIGCFQFNSDHKYNLLKWSLYSRCYLSYRHNLHILVFHVYNRNEWEWKIIGTLPHISRSSYIFMIRQLCLFLFYCRQYQCLCNQNHQPNWDLLSLKSWSSYYDESKI